MNTSRKIQIALGTIFLWSSTSISSFAATNSITSENFQSDSVKLPVESIPSGQLNSTQDTYLIAQMDIGAMLRKLPGSYQAIAKFEEAWKQSDRKQRLLGFCNSPPSGISVRQCYSYLKLWLMDKQDKYFESAMNPRNPRDPALEGDEVMDIIKSIPR